MATIITTEELYDTEWKLITVNRNKDKHPSDTLEGNYTMKFLEERRQFIEGKGSSTDYLLDRGWWSLDEDTNMITIHNRLNSNINRCFEITDYNSETNLMTFKVIHKKMYCALYSTFDEFILEKI